ncbi:MAG: HpcH/HpaI aldolase/citrate lyase family protein [Thermoanaerobaculia bacterium]
MTNAEGSLRSRVGAGESLLGCFLTWPSPGVAELLATAGFDFLVLDCEHGFFSIESVETMVTACDAARIPAVVRAPSATSDQVGRYLDAGAAGTLLPRIDGADSARGAIGNVKFAPLGRRGLGGVRANRYGGLPLDRFVTEQNEGTLVAVQIETPGALVELEGIASIPAVDVLYVGPNDLSQALGIPGNYQDSRYTEAVERVAGAAASTGRAAGIMLRSRDQIPPLAKLGYRFFTTSDRALVLESARAWRAALPRGRNL